MSRIRRISMTVAHREISVSVAQTSVTDDSRRTGEPTGRGEAPQSSDICPECGAPWISGFAGVLKDFSIPLEQLQAAILDRRLHSHWLPDGQFRVCERSLKTIKETSL